VGVDAKRGDDASNLTRYEDDSVDEIRASHILEHFSHRRTQLVLREWVRVLRPGGVLKISVPDFKVLAEQFLAGGQLPFEQYMMGGQTDDLDYHKALFDQETLSAHMKHAGVMGIRHWSDEIEDCAKMPISLNLAGTKPYAVWPKVAAVISMPRLGFNDFWECCVSDLKNFMPIRRITGAYWDSNLTQAIEEVMAEHDPEWVLTCDYDTVFDADHLMCLLDLAMRHPEADAIAPLQVARWHDSPMMRVKNPDGSLATHIDREYFTNNELVRIDDAHFGLTLLRASKLKVLDKPWMQRLYPEIHGEPCDPDMQFWRHWKAAGNTLYAAMRVPIGHCELMVRWADVNMEAIHQKPADFFKYGRPERVWR
jgi:SAM-dependent methyltransferase